MPWEPPASPRASPSRRPFATSAWKGSYVQLNHYHVKSGEMDEWTRLETTYWKALMDAWLKAGGKGGWHLTRLWRPAGDRTPYNAQTVDIFPDWNSLVRGVPVDELWSKVHPATAVNVAFNRIDGVRSMHSVEIYKVIEVIAGK